MPGSPDQADQTRRVQLPPEETGPVPVSLARAEPRWFGVPPPMLLLGLAVLSFAIAVALCLGILPMSSGVEEKKADKQGKANDQHGNLSWRSTATKAP